MTCPSDPRTHQSKCERSKAAWPGLISRGPLWFLRRSRFPSSRAPRGPNRGHSRSSTVEQNTISSSLSYEHQLQSPHSREPLLLLSSPPTTRQNPDRFVLGMAPTPEVPPAVRGHVPLASPVARNRPRRVRGTTSGEPWRALSPPITPDPHRRLTPINGLHTPMSNPHPNAPNPPPHLRAKSIRRGPRRAHSGPGRSRRPGLRTGRSARLSTTPVGTTPAIIGLNSGNWIEGTNNATFWRWSGVNGSRTFTSAPNIEQVDDIPGVGDGVNSQASLLARMDAVRANPTDPTRSSTSPSSSDGYLEQPVRLRRLRPRLPHVQRRTTSPRWRSSTALKASSPFADPGTARRLRRSVRALAAHLRPGLLPGQQLRRRALQLLQRTRRRQPGTSPRPTTCCVCNSRRTPSSPRWPTSTATSAKTCNPTSSPPSPPEARTNTSAALDNSDTRDDQQGWGELVINNLNTNFLGEVDPDFQLIQTYGYQQYNQEWRAITPTTWNFIQNAVRDDLADNNLVGEVDFALTEFNVHSNGVFATRRLTTSTPRPVLPGSAASSPTSPTPKPTSSSSSSSTPTPRSEDFQKNAVFTNSRFDEPYNVGGATKAAGVLKLFTKGFAGANDLLETSEVHQQPRRRHQLQRRARHLLHPVRQRIVKTTTATFTFDLSALGIEPGAHRADRRSLRRQTRRGGRTEFTLGARRHGRLSPRTRQQRDSDLSVPRTAPDQPVVTLTATDDATVRAANNSDLITSATATTSSCETWPAPMARAAAPSDWSQFDGRRPHRRRRRRTGRAQPHRRINEGDAEFVTLHVYGIIGDGFDQDTITWDDVSNLADSTGDVSLIADNFLTGVSDTAEFVGHLTVTQATDEVLLDVTEFVQEFARRKHPVPDHPRSSFRSRPRRRRQPSSPRADAIDRSLGAVRFDSSENASDRGPPTDPRTARRGRRPRTHHRRSSGRPHPAHHPPAAALSARQVCRCDSIVNGEGEAPAEPRPPRDVRLRGPVAVATIPANCRLSSYYRPRNPLV